MVINGLNDLKQVMADLPQVMPKKSSNVSGSGFVKMLDSFQARKIDDQRRNVEMSRRNSPNHQSESKKRTDINQPQKSELSKDKSSVEEKQPIDVDGSKRIKKRAKSEKKTDSQDLDKKEMIKKAEQLLKKLSDKELGQKEKTKVEGELVMLLDLLSKLLDQENRKLDSSEKITHTSVKKGTTTRQEAVSPFLELKGSDEIDKAVENLVAKIKKVLSSREQVDQLTGKKDNSRSVKDLLQKVAAQENPGAAEIEVMDLQRSDFRKLRAKVEVKKRVAVQQVSEVSPQESNPEWEGRVRSLDGADKNGFPGSELGQSLQKSLLKGQAEFSRKTGIKEPRKLFHQIVERATIMKKSGMSEMRLQLNPKHLGRVKMQLVVKDGNVSAKIAVANEGLRQFLHENLESLGKDLQDAGITLQHMEVFAENRDRSSFANSNSDDNSDSPFLNLTKSSPEVVSEPTVTKPTQAHDGSVDLVA